MKAHSTLCDTDGSHVRGVLYGSLCGLSSPMRVKLAYHYTIQLTTGGRYAIVVHGTTGFARRAPTETHPCEPAFTLVLDLHHSRLQISQTTIPKGLSSPALTLQRLIVGRATLAPS